jgi:hypothetical protein
VIISQTPSRVSFAGGGTDLPAFYRHEHGAVLSATIDQHIYVTIHRRFEPTIRISYSRTEVASTLDEVQHELVRVAMRRVAIDEPLEITTIGPRTATGRASTSPPSLSDGSPPSSTAGGSPSSASTSSRPSLATRGEPKLPRAERSENPFWKPWQRAI